MLKYYLSRIARNLSFKRLEYLGAEKRGGNADLLLSELEECIPDPRRNPEEAVQAKQLGESVNRFLATLSAEDRGLFLCRYYYAMPTPQLAERFGISPRQVKYRLEKLRKALKKQLEKEGAWV